jgi:Mg2+ and Co2+ transporter CorA
LIVDDDPAIRMLCSINLQIEGLRALEAADGERGLEQARSERPDLVVTDVMMPGLDGFQLAEALRSHERTLLPDHGRLRRPDRRARGRDLPRVASDKQLQEIFAMKRLLVGMRKAVSPQRDAFAGLMGGVAELPGLAEGDERYFRDVYDHPIRISDLIDSYRDLLSSAMDVYLSTVSNRLNAVMKQLAVIATIFLPLAWLTGFFGQNFGWLVRGIGAWETFVGLGVGTELVALAILLAFFKRHGWF